MNKISSIGNSPYPEIDEVEAHRVGANFAHCQVQSGPRLCASELQGTRLTKRTSVVTYGSAILINSDQQRMRCYEVRKGVKTNIASHL